MATYEADAAVWIDNTSFMLFRYARKLANGLWVIEYGVDGLPPTQTLLGTIDSENTSDIDRPAGEWLSNGNGAVAFTRVIGDAATFWVWTATGISEANDGYAYAWSPAGDELAVLHPATSTGPGVSGSLQIIGWPSFEQIYADDQMRIGGVVFSPAGDRALATGAQGIALVNLLTGDAIPFGALESASRFTWVSDGIVATDDLGNAVQVYDDAGRLVGEFSGAGDGVEGSADRSTAVFFYTDTYPGFEAGLTTLRAGAWDTVGLPETLSLSAKPIVAPDGHAVIVVLPEAPKDRRLVFHAL